jgi:hypothetical protein
MRYLCNDCIKKIIVSLTNNNIIFVNKNFSQFKNIFKKIYVLNIFKNNFNYDNERIFQNIIKKLSLDFNVEFPITHNANGEVINYNSINEFLITSNFNNSWIFRDVWNDLFSFNNIDWNENEKKIIRNEFNIYLH